MRHEIWIYVMDVTFKTLVRWHLCISKKNITFMADAATMAMNWAQSHLVHNGRYEIHVLMLTPEQHDAIKPILLSMTNGITPPVAAAQLSRTTLKPIDSTLHDILKWKKMRLTDKDVGIQMNMTKDAVEKMLYRTRVFYGVRSTAELIDFLEASELM